MLKMNDKDERLTIRLTTKQMAYIDKLSEFYRCSKSDIIRMLINVELYKEGAKNEYEQTNSGSKL